jgi:hypothetical protein
VIIEGGEERERESTSPLTAFQKVRKNPGLKPSGPGLEFKFMLRKALSISESRKRAESSTGRLDSVDR